MKKPDIESFETQEYSEENDPKGKFGAIYQIVNQMSRDNPVAGCRAILTGNLVKIVYNCYEMHYPSRKDQVQDQAKQVLNNVVSELKKQYKKLRREELKLKEKKELADYTVARVSQNERYLYTSWRVFELGE